MGYLEEIIDILKASPTFNMSLGSKELFHSNFIAWLIDSGNIDSKEFLKHLLPGVVAERITSASITPVDREVENFDIRIWLENDVSVVFENKVKSLPYSEQLEDYSEKLQKKKSNHAEKAICILLSLTKPDFFNQDNELSSVDPKWYFVSYDKLANSLRNLTTANGYEGLLIKDYICFIDNLGKLHTACISSWKDPSILFKYKNHDYESLQTIRMHDIYEKWRMGEIRKRLEKVLDTRNIVFDIGYSKQQGLLDILPKDYKSSDGYFYSIQIQGNQLRQVLKTNKAKGDEIFIEANRRMEEGSVDQRWFLNHAQERLPENTLKKAKKTQYGFCKFDSTFAYRYEDMSGLSDLDRVKNLVEKMELLNANR